VRYRFFKIQNQEKIIILTKYSEEHMKLKDKVAIVTGGGKGIGRAIALRLAQDGAKIAILDIDLGSAQTVAGEINNFGSQGIGKRADLSQYAETKQAVDEVFTEFGRIDILVNNAGIDQPKPFLETDDAFWDRFIAVNYKSYLNACHACIPYLMKNGQGSIISMGSDAGRVGTAGELIYGGTKAAIMGSSKALARELAPFQITVNCISPGPIDTDIWRSLAADEKGKKIAEGVVRSIPLRRIGSPEDVAGVVAFFASDDARYITGQVLSVDGGLTMIG
jgi:2-hydroxycyclohexanecarboxyl-CoA dehydrogenase